MTASVRDDRSPMLPDAPPVADTLKGFAIDTPHAEYIRHKSFIVWNERSVEGMTGGEMEQVVLKNFRDAQPLVRWLRQVPSVPNA